MNSTWYIFFLFTVLTDCWKQSSKPFWTCISDQCHNLYDKNITTCDLVPYGVHPWSLKIYIQAECIPVSIDNTFTLQFVGKELLCNNNHLIVGFNPHTTDATEGQIKLCHVTDEEQDPETSLKTCFATCEAAIYLPELLFIDVRGQNMELCEISTWDNDITIL